MHYDSHKHVTLQFPVHSYKWEVPLHYITNSGGSDSTFPWIHHNSSTGMHSHVTTCFITLHFLLAIFSKFLSINKSLTTPTLLSIQLWI